MSTPQRHYHIAYGLAGYGPDAADDGYSTAETLAEALEAANDYLDQAADAALQSAYAAAGAEDYETAWNEYLLSEALDNRRQNQDLERRRAAPLYVDDDDAYSRLLQNLADEYPVDVGNHERLYLWLCDAGADCERDDDK